MSKVPKNTGLDQLPHPLQIQEHRETLGSSASFRYRGDFGYQLPGGGKLRVRHLDMEPFKNHAPTLRQLAEWILALPAPVAVERAPRPAKHDGGVPEAQRGLGAVSEPANGQSEGESNGQGQEPAQGEQGEAEGG